MTDAPVRIERAGPVAWCTVDRPPLNLLEPGLIRILGAAFAELGADGGLRAVVLTGGGRAFCAGMDVRVLRDLDGPGARALITALHGTIEAVHHSPVPVVAAVSGPCLGAGFELALACDMRLASADAIFGLPEVKVGVPSVIEAALLPPLVGPGRAAELLFTGETITAERALAWGLVNQVVEAPRLRDAVQALLTKILSAGPGAIRLQKRLFLKWRYSDLETAIRAGIEAFAEAYATPEPAEGAEAFLAKRAPRFEGRR